MSVLRLTKEGLLLRLEGGAGLGQLLDRQRSRMERNPRGVELTSETSGAGVVMREAESEGERGEGESKKQH